MLKVRLGLVIAFPLAVAWIVISTIWRETKSIPLYIGCEIGENVALFRKAWRDGL